MAPNANHAYESYLAHPPCAEQVFSFLFGPTPSLCVGADRSITNQKRLKPATLCEKGAQA